MWTDWKVSKWVPLFHSPPYVGQHLQV
jgi:hypothetical protein